MNCLRHASKLLVLNRHKCIPKTHEATFQKDISFTGLSRLSTTKPFIREVLHGKTSLISILVVQTLGLTDSFRFSKIVYTLISLCLDKIYEEAQKQNGMIFVNTWKIEPSLSPSLAFSLYLSLSSNLSISLSLSSLSVWTKTWHGHLTNIVLYFAIYIY